MADHINVDPQAVKKAKGIASKFGIVVVVILVLVLVGLRSIYSQDPGEVAVLRNWGGSLAGYTEEAGFHIKMPWQNVLYYDMRNNIINLYRDAPYVYNGGAAEGACVTINDKGGASADVDLQVIYSFDGDAALDLYRDYGTQEHFTSTYVQNDVRATAREVAGRFDTITLLTNRGEFTKALRESLEAKWEPLGLNIEQVSVQDVRYPEEITSAYAKAQSAEIERQRAQNEQETAKVKAETKIIEAQAEAEANKVLTESLSDQVLQQHYIDALREIGASGNLVVVPEGSQPIVGTSTAAVAQ